MWLQHKEMSQVYCSFLHRKCTKVRFMDIAAVVLLADGIETQFLLSPSRWKWILLSGLVFANHCHHVIQATRMLTV